MQWFKHSKDFRNSAAIKLLERKHGAAGYAYALKFMEVIAEIAGKRKPFEPTLTLSPPYDWRWLAIELGCYYVDEETGQNDLRCPSEELAVEVIRDFELAGFVSIEQECEYHIRKYDAAKGGAHVETELRPQVITIKGMKQWTEWHDLKNRNKKPDSAPGNGKVHFSGMGTPE